MRRGIPKSYRAPWLEGEGHDCSDQLGRVGRAAHPMREAGVCAVTLSEDEYCALFASNMNIRDGVDQFDRAWASNALA